jgi:cell division protein FtsB
MPSRATRKGSPTTVVTSGVAVHGLEHGRKHAQRMQRRRRRRDRVVTWITMTVVAGVLAGAGWVGYQVYDNHRTNQQIETERRVAEFQREQANQTVDDVIDELEQTPAWNGPGNPTFGVGNRDTSDTQPSSAQP